MALVRSARRGASRALNLALHEASRLRPAPKTPPRPVFMIGAPRTASTALYQLLTYALDVGYIDNMAARLYGDLPLGVALSRRRYGAAPHHSFTSALGATDAGGGHAPNEGGTFWYRWLPREDHFVEAGQISPGARRHLLQQVAGAERASGSPRFLFKNLNAGQRLRLIAEVFPQASVIWCRRDHQDTCASIIRARRDLDWPQDKIWSIRPKGWRELEGLPETELVDRQVRTLEAQIEQDLGLFAPERQATIWYDDWRGDLVGTVDRFQSFLDIPRRAGIADDDIRELPIR